eukprot:CAMPEP_0185723378 /NCGR_PEP_ID=MMETSP1171-20130828/240_1 /TAXON_ID=374046 /ORGANISM="Helicotheca tamensis, Strain CCMP826" /LENGTH=555 /DNA_ID=CAMNT_0028391071 /DNA_START=57 /DNA_END=1724 /DNA_ORIENTATION=+
MTRVSKFALALCLALSSLSPHTDAFTASPKSVASRSISSGNGIAFLPRANNGVSLFMAEGDDGKSTLVRLPGSAVEVTISAPGAATKAAYDKVCTELAKNISIPGFRKGARIPPNVIENAMAAKGGKNALRAQAITTLLSELIEPALKDEHNLEPIGQPELKVPAEELAEDFTPGEDIELVIKCDVWPDIQWKNVEEGQEKPYYGIKGSYKRAPPDQTKFDKAMKDLRERYATLEPMPEGAQLQDGDACKVNMVGYMAGPDGTSKGEPLPDAASGDNVEVILGEGRYMEGLVEGLLGAKVGDTRTVYVTFPTKLRDKTLAGKKAVFDVTVLEASHRTIPEVTDEFAANVRAGLTAESLHEELQKAVDAEDSKQYVNERNAALAAGLAERLDVEVPDTLVTNQAREKYALMMTEFRDNGMADDEIKKLITPENFIKYKDIAKPDIEQDFKVSMATDEIANLEGIDVPAADVDEQIKSLREQAAKEGQDEDFDEQVIRGKVESTLQRRLVFDFLAEVANLDVEYVEEEGFDADMMEKLAQESLEREETMATAEASDE